MNGAGFIKGVITGAVIGGAAMMIFDPVTPKQRKMAQRRTNTMFRNVGCMVDNMMSGRR